MGTFSALLSLCARNSPITVEFPSQSQWRGAWTDGCANNGDAGDLRRHCAHYDVTAICPINADTLSCLQFDMPAMSSIGVHGFRSMRSICMHTKPLSICADSDSLDQESAKLIEQGKRVCVYWNKVPSRYGLLSRAMWMMNTHKRRRKQGYEVGLLCRHPSIHRGRMAHICVSKLTIIGSHNGLSLGRRHYLNQCWNIVNGTLKHEL